MHFIKKYLINITTHSNKKKPIELNWNISKSETKLSSMRLQYQYWHFCCRSPMLAKEFLPAKLVITKVDQPSPVTPQAASLSPRGKRDKQIKSIAQCSSAFSTNFFSNVSMGYDILLHIFQYLKVQVSVNFEF